MSGLIVALLFGTTGAAPQRPPQPGIALALAAESQVGTTVVYDPSYRRLAYPGGDVPIDRGVCSDVVIRTFRAIGVDLQVRLHEDMKRSFREYPQMWRLGAPDPNIDHRRVPNLMTYFRRNRTRLPISAAYEPGDVVAWRLPNGLHHVGIVSTRLAPGRTHRLVVHNIGRGAQLEDILHSFEKLGHYRW